MTLEAKMNPPPFGGALFGAVAQLSSLWYFWGGTSAAECVSDPLICLTDFSNADVWGRQAVITVVIALLLWLYSVLHRTEEGTCDPSVVDRFWSVLPWVYVWHFYISDYYARGSSNPKLLLMACLSTAWGVRLTWNFWRKGGYSGGEDYRWIEVRKWFPGWKFEVFNLIFICLFQQLLLLAFVTPAVAVMQAPEESANPTLLDHVAAVVYTALLCGETVADIQMWNFQTEKYRCIGAKESLKGTVYEAGFIQSGLWSLSRHPNYFCEVTLWWAFYLFSIPATGSVVNWTGLGTMFLTLLFVPPGASLDLTEYLSSRKYPNYHEYQKRTSRFFPWFPAQGETKSD